MDVTHDSRQVRAGHLFVAVSGLEKDGNLFIIQALESGAVGVISEQERPADFGGAWIRVTDARRALALAAAEVHQHPSHDLQLVGITGTNGKTTTAYLIAALAEAAGEAGAMLTTVESQIGTERQKAERTTPEASDTQRFLRRAVEAGCKVAVMECSSQALHLHRCDGLRVNIAVFTNLTRDHLDYHRTMENYFAAKLCLFDGRLGTEPHVSIINLDDAYGVKLASELKAKGQRVVSYALENDADVTVREIEITLEGMRFELVTPVGNRTALSPLVGRPHIYNILSAVACGLELGLELEAIARGIEICAGAPGRFERVPHAGDFAVVVDYAHTDDALLNVLRTAREVARGRIITVFGCGGDRDRTKRAPMGEAAASLSDLVILTSDNPRTEDPLKILSDAEAGLLSVGKPYHKIADRREAIHHAIRQARTGDVVIIAGKGHEDYQIIGREVFHFDDREVAREALQGRGQ
ncbi:MAG: UDP-N-acetylmuramoyl-L-alanyl-D-glutamate--2,6-diaminopimelate ligase [Pyrinomonadaceae bacterium]|nr:UDP-N-acetylmuramoyl-L-alanyl-D-glutamate--2,6-diaminopimelate ligase [Pyrinomonadaceae bacterium]